MSFCVSVCFVVVSFFVLYFQMTLVALKSSPALSDTIAPFQFPSLDRFRPEKFARHSQGMNEISILHNSDNRRGHSRQRELSRQQFVNNVKSDIVEGNASPGMSRRQTRASGDYLLRQGHASVTNKPSFNFSFNCNGLGDEMNNAEKKEADEEMSAEEWEDEEGEYVDVEEVAEDKDHEEEEGEVESEEGGEGKLKRKELREKERDQLWKAKYDQLRDFKSENGHCDIKGNKHKQLGAWIRRQRYLWRNGKLCRERKKLLDELGFMWENNRAKVCSGSTMKSNMDATYSDNQERSSPRKKRRATGIATHVNAESSPNSSRSNSPVHVNQMSEVGSHRERESMSSKKKIRADAWTKKFLEFKQKHSQGELAWKDNVQLTSWVC